MPLAFLYNSIKERDGRSGVVGCDIIISEIKVIGIRYLDAHHFGIDAGFLDFCNSHSVLISLQLEYAVAWI